MSSQDQIDAIRNKITDAGYEVPDVNALVSWTHLKNEDIITGQEMVKIINAMILSAQQQGKDR